MSARDLIKQTIKEGEITTGAKALLTQALADIDDDIGRCIKQLRWMTATMRFKHDETGLNVGMYSPELNEAIALLDELENK
jgi:hypothetical protein